MVIDWKRVQKRLNELGFDAGPEDGIKGPRTETALVEFKKSVGLRARPYLGPITWQALMTSSANSDSPWMSEAVRMKGLHEVRDRSRLVKWFDKSVSWIDPREIAWCGAFVATCVRKYQPGIELPENPLGARNWLSFGKPVKPQLGAILVFWRVSRKSWQGHVGFYWGEDSTAFHVLGGNQSDAVTVTRIKKDRLLGARFPINAAPKGTVVHLASNGMRLSTNEA